MIVSPLLKEFYTRGKEDLIYFAEVGFKMTPTSQQADFFQLYSDMIWHPERVDFKKSISVHSGHGTGKDAASAIVSFHFITYFEAPKIIVVGPSKPQLFDVFRPELSKWYKRYILESQFELLQTRLVYRGDRDNSFLSIRTVSVKSSDDTADKIAGIHADHVLLIGDESSTIPDSVFSTTEGAITRPKNFRLLIGNPTKNFGYFYKTHYDDEVGKDYIKVHWNSRESSNVDQSFCDRIERLYGPESNQYRVKVLGLPPINDDEAFIQISWIEECRHNDIEESSHLEITAGLDTAREGADESVLLWGRGDKILGWRRKTSLDTVEIAYWAASIIMEIGITRVGVDIIRNPGVIDVMRRLPGLADICVEVNVSKSPPTDSRFKRLRDELWMRVQQKFAHRKYSLPQQEDLEDICNELASLRYEKGSEYFKIESKKRLLSRGEKSPNIADALMMREIFDNYQGGYHQVLMKKYNIESPLGKFNINPREAWMVV